MTPPAVKLTARRKSRPSFAPLSAHEAELAVFFVRMAGILGVPRSVAEIYALLYASPDAVDFDQVLMIGDGDSITVGAPVVSGAKVSAAVKGHGRHDKVRIVKFRRRKHYKREKCHRQQYTLIKVTGISA